MIAYKGFSKRIKSVLGNGIKECCTFELGKTYKETSSKTARSGFHCCENPFECLSYYSLGQDNRYFQVEAAGSIDEDDSERISCTEITLIKELTLKELAFKGMEYIIKHPAREKWQQSRTMCKVEKDKSSALEKDGIAIARGAEPVVKGVEGAILGLIVEPEVGFITGAKMFVCTKELEEKWLTLTPDRKLQEVEHEEKED